MNNQRRRANNFTDSLINFRQTFCENRSQMSRTFSQDSLDSIRIGRHRNDEYNHSTNNVSRGSIILAGNLVNEQFVSLPNLPQNLENYNNRQPLLRDTLNDDTNISYLPMKLDLNKCINLFHNKHLNQECDICEECRSYSTLSKIESDKKPCESDGKQTVQVQYDLSRTHPRATSSSSLKHLASFNQEIRKCKSCSMLNSSSNKDTNHNIKTSQFLLPHKEPESTIDKHKKTETLPFLLDAALSLPHLYVPSSKETAKDNLHSTEKNQEQLRNNSTNSEKSTIEELNPIELKVFLHSLGDQLKSPEEVNTQHLLRRLSINFCNSPENFTERLLTIIEESVINNDSSVLSTSAVNLSRLTAELRKMCKFIEDETVPEWPPSPTQIESPSISNLERKDQERSSKCMKKINADLTILNRNSFGTSLTPDKDLYSTVATSPRYNIKTNKKVYRCTPKNISTNMKMSMYDNSVYNLTSTFEYLEAHCKQLFPEEHKTSPAQKNILRCSLQNINNILNTCENQMASLEDSPNICEQKTSVSIADFENQCNVTPKNFPHRSFSHKIQDKAKLKNIFNTPKQSAEYNDKSTQLNDLENAIIYEIAKKRQRCLNTAKVMMEIDSKAESIEEQEIYPNIISYPNLLTNDNKLMEMLMSCMQYQNYLEEHKSLLNLFEQSQLRDHLPHDKKDVQIRRTKRTDITTSEIPKSATIKKKSLSPSTKHRSTSNKTVVLKPRLFVTPGKTPIKKCKGKRTYFPDLATGSNKQITSNISPHAKGIYRHMGLHYDSVISPVGMYIRGTDPHLIKNVQPKTDEMLLTPRKKQTVQSLSQKPKMKFRLSPKRCKETFPRTATGDENLPDPASHILNSHLSYPKVHYKLPSHIRTIKETERKVGNRVNELLRSTQNKVVIRHEGRVKSQVQVQYSDSSEICYDSTEESIHVEQIARKTNFHRA